MVRRVLPMSTQLKPPGVEQWTTLTMAHAVGITEASVRRIRRSHGVKPHRVSSFKISKDTAFACDGWVKELFTSSIHY